jgi:hypothetical protein
MENQETLKKIRELVILQHDLSKEFFDRYVKLYGYQGLLFAPKHGEINAGGFKWKFTKHGGGVYFSRLNDGLVVDMHKYIEVPDLFDAWRLKQFLKSYGKQLSEEDCLSVLNEMVGQGYLVESDKYHHFILSKS